MIDRPALKISLDPLYSLHEKVQISTIMLREEAASLAAGF